MPRQCVKIGNGGIELFVLEHPIPGKRFNLRQILFSHEDFRKIGCFHGPVDSKTGRETTGLLTGSDSVAGRVGGTLPIPVALQS